MARLSTLGIGLLVHWTCLARGLDPLLSNGDVVTAGLGLYSLPHTTPLERNNQTCAHSPINDPGSQPSDWSPWTHQLYCADTPYCVFTKAHFHGANGVSLITTPESVADTLHSLESTFATPFQHVEFPESPAYEVVDIPGKGKGAIAARALQRGEKFMVDYAGLIADKSFPAKIKMDEGRKLLETAVDQLPRGKQIRELAMSTDTTTRVVEDLLRTNAFGMTVGGRDVMVLFPEISRMNHACSPNVYTRFSEKTFAMMAMAVRDIEAGEELSISYSELGLTHSERQSFLRARWGFTCTCPICTATPSAILASDARREEIREIRDKVMAHVHKREFGEAAVLYVEMLGIMDEEEMLAPRGEHYGILARMYGAVGEGREVERWAGMAVGELGLFGGDEAFEEVSEMEELVSGARERK